jgi:cytochrome c peroxidase
MELTRPRYHWAVFPPRLLRRASACIATAVLSATWAAGADVTVSIAPRWGRQPIVVPSVAVNNTSGQALRITRFSALVSGISLLRADGSVLRFDGQFGFVDVESGRRSFMVRGVPEGEYAGIAFQIGLPSDVNHGDPGQWPAGRPLNPLVNRLHWNWRGGYIFTALEGRWTDGRHERGFSYHLATDARLMPVRFQAALHVAAATTISLALDLSRVIGNERLAADDGSESTHSGDGDDLAPRLGNAMEHAFFFLDAVAGVADVDRPGSTSSATSLPSADSPLAGARGYEGTPLGFTVPAGWPQPALPADNSLTVEGVALGERLFSDVRLSGNSSQSCASCHAPGRAFSDRVAFSRGADGAPGRRNAMPLSNLAWSPNFAWDGSQPRIRDQALAAMTNPIEMHGDPGKVVAALARDASLRERFATAFGTREITADRIGRALEQYLLTLVSADSKFDRAVRGETALTDEEKEGFALFMTEYDPARGRRGADCFHCHGGPLFSDFAFKNNGLVASAGEYGRETVTRAATDEGKFKTPSLRNVALTAPYMHDGRFAALEDVVAHYDHGIQRNATLDPNIAKHPDAGLGLTLAEQRALVAFLRSLTDER